MSNIINTYLKIQKCTFQEYQNSQKDANTIYFIIDDSRLYIGTQEYLTTNIPDKVLTQLNQKTIQYALGLEQQLTNNKIDEQAFNVYNKENCILFCCPVNDHNYFIINTTQNQKFLQYQFTTRGCFWRTQNDINWKNVLIEQYFTFDTIAQFTNMIANWHKDYYKIMPLQFYFEFEQKDYIGTYNPYTYKVEAKDLASSEIRCWIFYSDSNTLTEISLLNQGKIYNGQHFFKGDENVKSNIPIEIIEVGDLAAYTESSNVYGLYVCIGKDLDGNPQWCTISIS